MPSFRHILRAEMIKCKFAGIWWVTLIAFGLAPLMGAVFMIILRTPPALKQAGGLGAKAQLMNLAVDWNGYLSILTQAVGVGGVLIFGFVASWLFGREYSDGTAKDLLALPATRHSILNAKFVVYAVWCLVLVLSNLMVGLVFGFILQLPLTDALKLQHQLIDYATTTILTLPLGTLIAFFAVWGKGYLAPLGFVALTLVIAQVVAAVGFGAYFPWSVPGLYSAAGESYKEQLDTISYSLLALTSFVGYLATIVYWEKSDHSA